ncbi:unnamed protein product, partial [marine sediment metagenome]
MRSYLTQRIPLGNTKNLESKIQKLRVLKLIAIKNATKKDI